MSPRSLLLGVAVASAASGPLFVVSSLVCEMALAPGEAVRFAPSALSTLALVLFPPVLFYGFVLGLIPNFVGTLAMATLSERYEAARLPAAWIAAGMALGGLLAVAFGAREPSAVMTVVLTSALCAAICRFVVRKGIGLAR